MIGIGSQYTLTVTIEGYHDFLLPTDLLQLTIEERIGLFLPMMRMTFVVRDEGALSEIKENNNIVLTIGKDQPIRTMVFRPLKKVIKRRASNEYLVSVSAVQHKTDFLTKPRIRNFIDNSLNVMSTVLSEHFEVKVESKTPSDSMNWIQYNIPDKKFLNEVMLHSYIPDSVILPCIHSDGIAYLRDIRTMLGNDPKWKFSDTDRSGFIPVGADRVIESNTGFHNIYYDRRTPTVDILTGSYNLLEYSKESLLALYGVDVGISKMNSRIVPTSDNVHSDYSTAYNQNITILSQLVTTSVSVTISDRFEEFRLGDTVYFRDTSAEIESLESELISGIYIIDRLVYDITAGRTNIAVYLTRDYLNI